LLVVLVALRALEQRVVLQPAGVQERDVAGVDAALEGLQPVALLQALGGVGLLRGHQRELELRQRRLAGRIPHVGPEDVADLDQRVRGELDVLAEARVVRLRGDLDALAGDVVLPAVVGAAQAALLVAAEPQRGAAVGAELVDQAVAAVAVAERDEPLRQQLEPDRGAVVLRELLGDAGPYPVLPEQLPHRRARAGAGQKLVDVLAKHGTTPPSEAWTNRYTYPIPSGLNRRHVDRQPIELGRDGDLAGQPAPVAPLGDREVEEVLLHVARRPDGGPELLAHPDVAGGAGRVAPALADDLGHPVLDRGRHHGLADDGVDGVLRPDVAHVEHLRPRCDYLSRLVCPLDHGEVRRASTTIRDHGTGGTAAGDDR